MAYSFCSLGRVVPSLEVHLEEATRAGWSVSEPSTLGMCQLMLSAKKWHMVLQCRRAGENALLLNSWWS